MNFLYFTKENPDFEMLSKSTKPHDWETMDGGWSDLHKDACGFRPKSLPTWVTEGDWFNEMVILQRMVIESIERGE